MLQALVTTLSRLYLRLTATWYGKLIVFLLALGLVIFLIPFLLRGLLLVLIVLVALMIASWF